MSTIQQFATAERKITRSTDTIIVSDDFGPLPTNHILRSQSLSGPYQVHRYGKRQLRQLHDTGVPYSLAKEGQILVKGHIHEGAFVFEVFRAHGFIGWIDEVRDRQHECWQWTTRSSSLYTSSILWRMESGLHHWVFQIDALIRWRHVFTVLLQVDPLFGSPQESAISYFIIWTSRLCRSGKRWSFLALCARLLPLVDTGFWLRFRCLEINLLLESGMASWWKCRMRSPTWHRSGRKNLVWDHGWSQRAMSLSRPRVTLVARSFFSILDGDWVYGLPSRPRLNVNGMLIFFAAEINVVLSLVLDALHILQPLKSKMLSGNFVMSWHNMESRPTTLRRGPPWHFRRLDFDLYKKHWLLRILGEHWSLLARSPSSTTFGSNQRSWNSRFDRGQNADSRLTAPRRRSGIRRRRLQLMSTRPVLLWSRIPSPPQKEKRYKHWRWMKWGPTHRPCNWQGARCTTVPQRG